MISKHNNSIKSIALVILLTLIVIKVTDLALLKYLSHPELLFPPNSKVAYKTIEFDALVSINQFGFRGDETEITKGQILVIGDSTTYGWGLDNADVWARHLENKLKSSGLDLKVYNLGVPGTDSAFHLEVADRYVRHLKPKFVVISVLIGDDFQQVLWKRFSMQSVGQRANNPASLNWRTIFESAKSISKTLFPGLYTFYAHARYFNFENPVRESAYSRHSLSTGQAVLSITQNWGKESLKIVRDRKLYLPDDILERAMAGDINPGLLLAGASAAALPDNKVFWDKVKELERDVLVELTKKFSDLSSLTKDFGGRLIVFSMPNGLFVNSEVTENYRKYGMKIPEDNLVTYEPETILEQMAKSSDALFIPSLAEFRGHKGAALFFPLDGHATPEGSRLVANIIGNALLSQSSVR